MEKLEKIIKKHKIAEEDAKVLTSNIDIIEFFERIIENKDINPKMAVPWITTELLGMLNYNKKTLNQVQINPDHFIQLLKLVENKKITELKAKDILRSWKEKSSEVKLSNIEAISDSNEIEKIVEKVLESKENTKAVEDYKAGNKATLNFLIGAVMKATNKRADYQTAKKLLESKLK